MTRYDEGLTVSPLSHISIEAENGERFPGVSEIFLVTAKPGVATVVPFPVEIKVDVQLNGRDAADPDCRTSVVSKALTCVEQLVVDPAQLVEVRVETTDTTTFTYRDGDWQDNWGTYWQRLSSNSTHRFPCSEPNPYKANGVRDENPGVTMNMADYYRILDYIKEKGR